MILDGKPRPPTTPFPFVGLAFASLIAYTILLTAVPPNPYRSAVAIVALFATGYCTLALIVGTSFRLSAPEVLAFSVGLTILVTSISALAVSIIGIPITDLAIVILGLPIGFAAWYLRRSHLGAGTALRASIRRVFDFSDYSGAERLVIGVLLGAIAISLALLISLSGVLYPDRLSPGLAIAGPDGSVGTLPTSFVRGVAQDVAVSALGGSTSGSYEVRVRLIPSNATGNATFHAATPGPPIRMDAYAEYVVPITLEAQGTWNQTLSISIESLGNFDLRFELVDSLASVVATARLPVTAT